jgi:hypothetical protein
MMIINSGLRQGLVPAVLKANQDKLGGKKPTLEIRGVVCDVFY